MPNTTLPNPPPPAPSSFYPLPIQPRSQSSLFTHRSLDMATEKSASGRSWTLTGLHTAEPRLPRSIRFPTERLRVVFAAKEHRQWLLRWKSSRLPDQVRLFCRSVVDILWMPVCLFQPSNPFNRPTLGLHPEASTLHRLVMRPSFDY